ncbi:hypothetical protein B0H11DRAFT_2054642 [Mycena galericulata]|nr:hypothetical protein B0H11DRAFT_2054642 [Mycena galericulata]
MLSLQSTNGNAGQMQPPQDIQPQRTSRKRKSPPASSEPSQLPTLQHMISPMGPGYSYGPDFSPAGLPPQNPPAAQEDPQHQSQSPPPNSQSGRALSSSKRAEQNRKAQRAFRQRRDERVKDLETRAALLDTALASADEANRRWVECRALVDQLRVENTALRAALSQAQMLPPGAMNNHGAHLEETEAANGSGELKNPTAEGPKDQS